MATFNPEAIIKTVEKRLDKIEASITALEKSVKVLIDTRGDNKEEAVRKLQLVVQDQSTKIQKIPSEQLKALQAAMDQNTEQFKRMVSTDQARAQVEFRKADLELRKEIQRITEESRVAEVEIRAQMKLLEEQARAQGEKREQARSREMSEMSRQITDANKAQVEALRNSALLEARFTKLEIMVNAALTLAAKGK